MTMASSSSPSVPSPSSSSSTTSQNDRLKELEAKAVAEATASADDSFVPSPSLLNASTATALLQQVDGPSLANYESKESIYVGRSVPVGLRAKIEVPIHVTAPGSVVEYAVESKGYDIQFGIVAEREEGKTLVKEIARVDAHLTPLTGKFLVGSVPCRLVFTVDNEYSWFREKLVSYRITVTPPSAETLMSGRRRRAKACQKMVEEDLKAASQRLASAEEQKQTLQNQIASLEKEMEEKKKSLEAALNEQKWLDARLALRNEQKRLLQTRLTEGWEDEQ